MFLFKELANDESADDITNEMADDSEQKNGIYIYFYTW